MMNGGQVGDRKAPRREEDGRPTKRLYAGDTPGLDDASLVGTCQTSGPLFDRFNRDHHPAAP